MFAVQPLCTFEYFRMTGQGYAKVVLCRAGFLPLAGRGCQLYQDFNRYLIPCLQAQTPSLLLVKRKVCQVTKNAMNGGDGSTSR